MRTLFILVLLLIGAAKAQATTLFKEDWEGVPLGPISTSVGGAITGSTGQALHDNKGWTVACVALPCSSEIVSMTGHAGNTTNALRMRYSNSECFNDPTYGWSCNNESALKHEFAPSTDIYERYWVKFEQLDNTSPAFGFPNSSKQHEINTSEPWSTDRCGRAATTSISRDAASSTARIGDSRRRASSSNWTT